MNKVFKYLIVVFIILLGLYACNTEPDYTTEVIEVKNSISYYEGDSKWWCRDAMVYINHKLDIKIFPIQYQDDIKMGTKIQYHCHKVTAYYKDNKKILIDWEGTKEN